jgi:16S rRNA (guanine527-N7)-methyltransferase
MTGKSIYDEVARLLNVSRETQSLLDRFVALVQHWSKSINLVGPASLTDIWDRHVADSAQLLLHARGARTWIDLGAGGGFPGLIVAILRREDLNARVHLVESNAKKCAFLREVSRILELRTTVHCARIESFVVENAPIPDVVSARALAPLAELLRLAAPLLEMGGQALFLKGAQALTELTAVDACWHDRVTLIKSLTDPKAFIVRVSQASPEFSG